MNIVKSVVFKNVFQVDSGIFPYMDFKHKFKKGVSCWGNASSELKQNSWNFVGSCEFIALISVLRSAPYFMYYIHSNHENDDWANITTKVDERISQPDLKLKSTPTLAGDYLAMELLKTSRVNSSQNQDTPKLFRRNYLEHFSWLVGYGCVYERKLGIFRRFLKVMYRCTNCWCFTHLLNKKYMEEAYDNQQHTKGNFFRIIYENLFPNLDEPLFFKDHKDDNTFQQTDDPFLNNILDMDAFSSILSFYPDIHFWFLSLISKPQDHGSVIYLSEPRHERVNPVNLLNLISEKGKNHIKMKGKDELPYWMQ
ncbi:hypothetical protein SNEBB_004777, partial [Seison nebaliae]